MTYDTKLIGSRLKQARKAKHYTQDYVSARANIGEKFLSQIERGKAGLSVQTLLSLCEILEVSPNSILLAQSDLSDSRLGELMGRLTPRQRQDAEAILTVFVRNCLEKAN